ncbi:unnamed protein product [Phytophthora lilii]|uniref:Unnamed protein product n=1 Tax=Phytophthora lilii TaxID=2077276 RepID=A0A9W6U1T5_9STRA|nr:unnamed protein product [Phytophthora lilii]
MPYARITSNIPKDSVNAVEVSSAIAKTLNEAWGVPTEFMMVQLELGVPVLLNLNDEVNSVYIPALKIDMSDAVLAELEMTAATLYMRTDSLFPQLHGQPTISFTTQDKRGDPLGTYIETMTTTPMNCPLHLAADILWRGTTKQSNDPEKVPRFVSIAEYDEAHAFVKLTGHCVFRWARYGLSATIQWLEVASSICSTLFVSTD